MSCCVSIDYEFLTIDYEFLTANYEFLTIDSSSRIDVCLLTTSS